jgi:putative ABC transport system substrate-binding protein
VLPRVSRVAVLSNPANQLHATMLDALRNSAQSRGVQLVLVEARDATQLASAVSSASSGGAGALMVLDDGVLLFPHRARIAALALKSRLPATGGNRMEAEAGYLLTYGVDVAYISRQTAVFVDRILKGARPADLPVEQPGKLDLLINLRTAKALGLTIPPSVLARATDVIE